MIKNLLKNRKKRFSFYGILTLIIAVFFGGSYAATISQMSSNGIKGFDVINYFTINMIAQEIKNAILLLDGVTLSNIEYHVYNDRLYFDIELTRLSEKISLNLSVSDGVAM